MAAQTVTFKYDPERNILFADDDFEIASTSDAQAFIALYREQLTRIGRKVWIVTGIDGLRVGPKVYDYYGQMLKTFADQWYLGIARWGSDTVSRMMVRSASKKAKYDINIYDTAEHAVAAVEKMKAATEQTGK
jgi:hypothetical protein